MPCRAAGFVSLLVALGGCTTARPSAEGPVLEYVRSNSDGSEAERIVIHVAEPGKVEVFKQRAPCSNAAYVTARLDGTGQARSLVGGSLTRALTQAPTAWMDYRDGKLEVRTGSDRSAPILILPVSPRWVLYDFDLADLISTPPAEIRAGAPVSFELPLALVNDTGLTLTNRGSLALSPLGAGRYAATGATTGQLQFRRDGRLLEARLALPNHAEYRDFQLRLVKEHRGVAAWRRVLAGHWTGCPPAS